jgi:hypothetical protein
MKRPKRRFRSLLLLAEAKTTLNLNRALPQLVIYLASLRQTRLQRNRSNATVYVVVSDAYGFTCVTITHEGELKQSTRFEITEGKLQVVLHLRYIFRHPTRMPEIYTGGVGGDESKCHTREGWR